MKTGQILRGRRWLAGVVMIGAAVCGVGAAPGDTGEPAARKGVRAAVLQFSRFADEQRADRLEALLHPEFRVWAQIKGQPGVMALSREVYLQKIRSKEFGGDARKVRIKTIQVRGDLALVVAESRGAKARFASSYHLVRGERGWQLTNDMAEVTFLP